MSRFVRDQSGYSLVEVMVAIMLLAIAIIPMVGMFDAGLRAAVLGSNYDQARTLANEKLEEVKALDYSDVLAKYPPPGDDCEGTVPSGYDCEVNTVYVNRDLNPDPSARTTMRVDVTVSWDSDNKFSTSGLMAVGSP